MRDRYQTTIRIKPSLLLAGDTPRLIDEWQEAPVLWDSVRAMVDKRNEFGQFIMTGSNSIDPHKKKNLSNILAVDELQRCKCLL